MEKINIAHLSAVLHREGKQFFVPMYLIRVSVLNSDFPVIVVIFGSERAKRFNFLRCNKTVPRDISSALNLSKI